LNPFGRNTKSLVPNVPLHFTVPSCACNSVYPSNYKIIVSWISVEFGHRNSDLALMTAAASIAAKNASLPKHIIFVKLVENSYGLLTRTVTFKVRIISSNRSGLNEPLGQQSCCLPSIIFVISTCWPYFKS